MAIGTTERIADFVFATNYRHIPQEGINTAKNAILDYLGVTIAGSVEPAARITAEQAKLAGAVAEAGVICHNFQTSAELAAWVNGVASHALDYDDTFSGAVDYNIHPSVPILPAVLSLGENCQASGKEILTAYITGIEVESRVGSDIGRYVSELCWHPTPIIGVIAATVASAKILKLNSLQTRMALGIASSLAGGMTRNFGTMTKPLHAGNAARGGVVAALLAKAGFTADTGVMEGKYGFYDLFSGSKVSEPTGNESDLGDSWDIVSKGITFKPYPCCRGTHPSIDAVLYLREAYEIHADQVAAIICKTTPATPRILRHHQPKTGLEAKFSLEYCTAVALLRGKILLEDFTNKKVNEPAVQELVRKVGYLHPQDWENELSLTHEVVVQLENGTEYSHMVSVPKGDPENPMSDEELLAKFVDCTHSHLPHTQTEQAVDMITNLESLNDISRLMQIFTQNTRAAIAQSG